MTNPMDRMLSYPLLYTLQGGELTTGELRTLLRSHPEIRFVSLVAVDLGGNDTDEKIPVEMFLEDIEHYMAGGSVQTDGSSVVLPGIATLNDGKVDLIPDVEARWFVDYNYGNPDPETGKPVGTLRIPSFLNHNERRIDSRSILLASVNHFAAEIRALLQEYPHAAEALQISPGELREVVLTSATELEFWVKTPEEEADVNELAASQQMQEQYWKRTKGLVRTAMERSLTLLDLYGMEAEMGHKEVGGVKARMDASGNFAHVLEQLEIDWKYAPALQAADNELQARIKIKEVFQNHGLEASFMAKPIGAVAGNGEHTHIGVSLGLESGGVRNLFSPLAMDRDYLNLFGWGALMGILKNYEVINPFISGTNDALNRLQPGFEAPICIVASIGHSLEIPSRNRTILVGLIRDLDNPGATRFEVRSPNPHSNTYLTLAALYQAALDGIRAAVASGRTSRELEEEFSKKYGEEKFYLETDREYRSEEDVFEAYSREERDRLFGIHPSTVWEMAQGFHRHPEKLAVLRDGDVFTDPVIASYELGILTRWKTEILSGILPAAFKDAHAMKPGHQATDGNQLDVQRWEEIVTLRRSLFKDDIGTLSLATRLRQALQEGRFADASGLQKEFQQQFSRLKSLYSVYKGNII